MNKERDGSWRINYFEPEDRYYAEDVFGKRVLVIGKTETIVEYKMDNGEIFEIGKGYMVLDSQNQLSSRHHTNIVKRL